MAHRVYNFSAGPAVLPVPVLEQVQREMMELPGAGASILEISHRSGAFAPIIEAAEKDGRAGELERELKALFTAQNRGGDVTVVPATYLKVTVTKN